MLLKQFLISISLMTLIFNPSKSHARKLTLTGKPIESRPMGNSYGINAKRLQSLMALIDSSFTIKLPGHVSRVGSTILATTGSNQTKVLFAQNHLEGPLVINEFALKVSKALASGTESAGLPRNLNLVSAQKVVVGLLTALLLIQSESVPSCKIGPTKVGLHNVTGCLSTSSDIDELRTYFVNKGIQGVDAQLYEKARRLMFSMMAGAGLFEYQNSKTHNLYVDSAYAKLWISFLEKINSQGENPKPVVAFIEAFDELNSSHKNISSPESLSAILEDISADDRGKAMDSFFSACAPRVGL